MYIVLVIFTPDEVTLWEAVITLLSFPVLVINSYMAEMNFFFNSSKEDLDEVLNLSEMCKLSTFKKVHFIFNIIIKLISCLATQKIVRRSYGQC